MLWALRLEVQYYVSAACRRRFKAGQKKVANSEQRAEHLRRIGRHPGKRKLVG